MRTTEETVRTTDARPARLPVHEPDIGDAERAAVMAALGRGEISGSFGTALPEFERRFAEYVGCAEGVAVSSGTTALQLAVRALDLAPGDEVLVSACTNVATALAPYYVGAVPVPVDSEPATWNLDLDRLEALITPRTRAIIPVHIYGHPVDMDRLMTIADAHGLAVIEDCAESHGATWRGRMTGSFGTMSCFSFYANKVITTGEGGMVLTDEPALAARVRSLRNLAFSQPRFLHQEPGYNFRMTGMQAALGLAQLDRIEAIVAAKRRVAALYDAALSDIDGLQLPVELPGARNVYWMYGVVVQPSLGIDRDRLARTLADAGIETRTFFCPMNLQPFLRAQPGFRDVPCPVAESLWRNGLYLPSSNALDEDDVARVASAIRDARRRG
jgi:perosamine synthetase